MAFALLFLMMSLVIPTSGAYHYYTDIGPTWDGIATYGDTPSTLTYSATSQDITFENVVSCSHGWLSSCSSSEYTQVAYAEIILQSNLLYNHQYLQITTDFISGQYSGGSLNTDKSHSFSWSMDVWKGSTKVYDVMKASVSISNDLFTIPPFADDVTYIYGGVDQYDIAIRFYLDVDVSHSGLFPWSGSSSFSTFFSFEVTVKAYGGFGE